MDGIKILSMSVENFCFLDSLNFMHMRLKNMPKTFDLNARMVITLIFNRLTIKAMWARTPNLNTMGWTLCMTMIEPDFWLGMRSRKTKFFTIRKKC